VDREGGVVGFDDGVGNLGGRAYGVGAHNAVGVLLTDLGDKESSHASASAAADGVSDLEALKAIAGLRLFTDNVKNGIDEFGAFGVVALCPVITSASLSEDEIIGAEQLSEGTGTDRIHGAGFEIHEDGTRDITAASGFIEINIDPLELEIGVTVVSAGGIYAMFVGDDLPELGTDLVAALAGLDVDEFAHGV
jgi:hypothetical protein